MRTFAQEPAAARQTTSHASVAPDHARSGHSREANLVPHFQRTTGDESRWRVPGGKTGDGDATTGRLARFDHDFSRIPIHFATEGKSVEGPSQTSRAPVEKAEGKEKAGGSIIIETNGPVGAPPPAPAPTPTKAPAQAPAAPKKTAGVDSFAVAWKKNANAGPTLAKLRLDATAKFKKDATHDPALAEYRQNAAYNFEVTAGPNKGVKSSQPLQDDHYSRADDIGGHTINDVNFETNDNPGNSAQTPIDKDDVINYSFTAEQMIVDTSDGNKVVEKRGPHTGTITGKDPRTFGGVPATLS